MTDYIKHEWPELTAGRIEKNFNWENAGEEERYQVFKARLIRELVAENSPANSSGFLPIFDAENKPLHNLSAAELQAKMCGAETNHASSYGLNAAELQADAGRSTRHGEYCLVTRINAAELFCTCSALDGKQ